MSEERILAPGESRPAIELPNELRPAVNLRSFCVGLLGVIFICAFTPFNDYVLNNSVLIGGSLPVAMVLFLFLFALFINGPLSRFAPRAALQTNEMTVVLVMMLVACVMPGKGLMAFWPSTVAIPWKWGSESPVENEAVFKALNLPDWLWPKFTSNKFLDRTNDDVINFFYGRVPPGSPNGTYVQMLRAWVGPTISWGIFIFAMFFSLIGMSFILRKQWVENERITFPLALVQMSLVDAPRPRMYFNETFSATTFWVGFALVLALRALQASRQFFPKTIPTITLGYNFTTIFTSPPFSYIEYIQWQDFFPLLAAVMFFASTRITFSLWFFILLKEFYCMGVGMSGGVFAGGDRRDMNLGSLLAFALMILWTGRHHYTKVARLMFSPSRRGEETGRFIQDRTAGWLMIVGATVAIGWLYMLGMSWPGAIFLVAGLQLIWLVMANVTAHSGLLVAYTYSGPREWALDIYTNKAFPWHLKNQFWVQTFGGMWAYSSDQLAVYTTHGLKAATEQAPRAGRKLFIAIAASLLIGYLVSETSTLLCYYHYNDTQDKSHTAPINKEVTDGQPKWTMGFSSTFVKQGVPKPPHKNGLRDTGWVAGGFVGTAALAFCNLRYTWWPLHPIGLLMVHSYAMRRVWFSIFIGWLAKVLVVRFGGASTFKKARPFFTGIILGEVTAAGLFALLAVVLYWCGVDFESVKFLPTSQF